jgi:hypothetical protein
MRTETASNTTKVSSSEHNRIYSRALAMLERARLCPLYGEVSYLHSAKGVTLSISLIKKQDYVAVIILCDYLQTLFSKSKILNTIPLLEGAMQLAEQVRHDRILASRQQTLIKSSGKLKRQEVTS